MPIYDVRARYGRKVQVREYEPVEAELELKYTVQEGEDPDTVIQDLMAKVRTAVHTTISGKIGTTIVDESAAVKKPSGTDKPKASGKGKGNISDSPEDRKNPDDAIPDDDTSPTDGAIPDDGPSNDTTSDDTTSDDTTSDDGIPDEEPSGDDVTSDESASVITPAEMQKATADLISKKKIAMPAVKEALAAYNAVKMADVPEDKREALMAKIRELAGV